jgi:hypothetical protein
VYHPGPCLVYYVVKTACHLVSVYMKNCTTCTLIVVVVISQLFFFPPAFLCRHIVCYFSAVLNSAYEELLNADEFNWDCPSCAPASSHPRKRHRASLELTFMPDSSRYSTELDFSINMSVVSNAMSYTPFQ